MTNVDLHSLRRHIGTVMQNSRLFSGDILNNIILSAPSCTEEEAWKAAEMAGIAETGAYDELIRKNGIFAQLVSRQQVDCG